MAKLKDVMVYLIGHYPSGIQHELSNARLTKMVYLADWHQAINHERQITDIKWYFDNYGPFVRDVEREASKSKDVFCVDLGSNMYGQPKKMISLRSGAGATELTEAEIQSLDHIISITQKLYWDDFIKVVYATHPIASSERYSFLNLVEKSQEYIELKKA